MDPLFALPLAPAPIFGRSTNFEYKKILPDTIFNTSSPSQRHVFRIQNNAAEWWIPARSYLRLRWQLVKLGGLTAAGVVVDKRPVTITDGVAPIMNFCPALFSRLEYYMDGNKLSDLQDYIPQIDTMKHRQRDSKAYQSSVADRQNFMSPDFLDRLKLVCPPEARQGTASSIMLMSDSLAYPNFGAWVPRAVGKIGTRDYMNAALPIWKLSGTQTVSLYFLEPDYTITGTELATVFATGGDVTNAVVAKLLSLPFFDLDLTNSWLTIGNNTLGMPAGVYKIVNLLRDVIGRVKGLVLLTGNSVTSNDAKAGVANWVQWSPLVLNGGNAAGDFKAELDFAVGGAATSLSTVNGGSFFAFTASAAYTAATACRMEIIHGDSSAAVTGSSRQETLWTPPLGIFDIGHALPTTRHELHFVIPNDFQQRALEFGYLGYRDVNRVASLIAAPGAAPDATVRYRLEIESMEFFAACVSGPRADDSKFVLDLREYRMSPLPIPSDMVNNPNTYAFNLSQNSSTISVTLQSGAVGNGIMPMTEFHLPSGGSSKRGGELGLSRFYVNFAGQNRPREENESILDGNLPWPSDDTNAYNGAQRQWFTQRYLETMWNTGLISTQGGCESFEEWLARGPYYHWVWPRDGGDLSTRFHVFLGLTSKGTTEAQQINSHGYDRVLDGQPNVVSILVFDTVARPFMISIRNGNVVSAETSDAMVPDGVRRIRLD